MGAAFAAWLRLGSKASYIGMGHGGAKKLPSCVDGKNVAILDFSFDKETMAELKQRAKSFIVLDHHFSAMKSLSEVDDSDKVRYLNLQSTHQRHNLIMRATQFWNSEFMPICNVAPYLPSDESIQHLHHSMYASY